MFVIHIYRNNIIRENYIYGGIFGITIWQTIILWQKLRKTLICVVRFMDENSIAIDGIKLSYRHWGSGKPVVLFHGIPTDSSLWNAVVSHLKGNYSVYAFDLLGFGKSERLESSRLDIKSQAVFFKRVFKEMAIEKPIIAGHDIGGGIAQILAVNSPGSVRALILIDSVCYDSWPIELLSVGRNVELLFENLPEDVVHDLFIKYIRDGMFNKDNAANVAGKYLNSIENQEGIKSFLNAVKSLNNKYTIEIAPQLKDIWVPSLILWGRHDTYLRLSYAYRLSEDIRGSVLEVIENAGHFLPEDQPEKVADAISRFLCQNK